MSVTVFGSLNLDIALRLPSRARWGETLIVDQAAEALGGKGLNQAIAAARFGAATRMAGAVGDDAAGTRLVAGLAEAGVETGAVARIAGARSGRATILIEPAGENMIAVEAGANHAATAAGALSAIDGETRVVLAQNECDIGEIAALFAHPALAGKRRMLNAAPAVASAARLFGLADMLIFNQSEFAAYLQLDAEPETLADLAVARRLLTLPNQAVVVTLGAKGAAAIRADGAVFSPAFPAAQVVDTSGAGDCFCGVLAACVDLGIGMEAALRYANAAAALAVQAEGAAPAMPGRAAVEGFLGRSG